MTKKVNWDNVYSDPVRRNLSGSSTAQPKYTSGKDRLQKAFQVQKEQEQAENMLKKAMPAMSALLKCRLENKTPLEVRRPLVYMTSEMQKSERGASFIDTQKTVNPGTNLILKGLDPNLQEFIFEDENGNEIVLPYTAQKQLMTQTNIYEDVKKFIENKGE